MDIELLKYPIGKYNPQAFSPQLKNERLNEIKWLPEKLEASIVNLDEQQLHTPYRPDGWTIKQVVHHVADSHINAYCRFKLALTEDEPTIKPYDENKWLELNDAKMLPINISLTLLHALHKRLYTALADLPDEAWIRTYVHPDIGKPSTVWNLLGMYAWHGKHHTAHITSLRERMGW